MKAQHEQVKVDRSQTLTEFIKEDEVNLTHGIKYDLTDMAVTSDNKLLLQMSCFSLFIFSSFFSCTDSTSVINLSSMSSRYFRTFDLAALICFIINDFLCCML
jgi:hypothetical protein